MEGRQLTLMRIGAGYYAGVDSFLGHYFAQAGEIFEVFLHLYVDLFYSVVGFMAVSRQFNSKYNLNYLNVQKKPSAVINVRTAMSEILGRIDYAT